MRKYSCYFCEIEGDTSEPQGIVGNMKEWFLVCGRHQDKAYYYISFESLLHSKEDFMDCMGQLIEKAAFNPQSFFDAFDYSEILKRRELNLKR